MFENSNVDFLNKNVPMEMKSTKQWILWKQQKCGEAKPRKIPCDLTGRNMSGDWLHRPGTWYSYDTAVCGLENPEITGLGFVLTEDDPFACLDADGIDFSNPGEAQQNELNKIISDLNNSFSETSISGNGFHTWFKCEALNDFPISTKGKQLSCGGHLELWIKNRWIAFTAKAMNSNDIKTILPDEFRQFAENYEFLKTPKSKPSTVVNVPALEMSDSSVISALSTTARRIYNGDIDFIKKSFPGENEFGIDTSAADYAVLMGLAEVVGKDENRVWALFQDSSYYKYIVGTMPGAKQATRDDYKKRTLERIFEDVQIVPSSIVELKRLAHERKGISDAEFSEYLIQQGIFDNFQYNVQQRQFAKYNGKIWVQDAMSAGEANDLLQAERVKLLRQLGDDEQDKITKKLVNYVADIGNSKKVRGLMETLQSLKEIRINNSQFDCAKKTAHVINFADCRVEIVEENGKKTVQVSDFRKDDFITKQMNVGLKGESTGFFKSYIDGFFSSENIKTYFMQAIGSTLIGKLTEKAVFFLYGTRDTGKSSLMDAICEAMGGYSKTISPQLLTSGFSGTGNTPEIAQLQGVRLAHIAEMSNSDHIETAAIKSITGNAKITAQAKFKDPVEFDNSCTLWVETNELPRVKNEADTAFYSRVKVIPCYKTIAEKDRIIGFKDKLLEDNFGMGNFLLECLKLYCENGLIENQEIADTNQEYKISASYILQFASEKCVVSDTEDTFCKREDLYKQFIIWANENGCKYVPTLPSFSATLKNNFPSIIVSHRKRTQNGNVRVIKGIRMKTELEEFDDTELPFDVKLDDEEFKFVSTSL